MINLPGRTLTFFCSLLLCLTAMPLPAQSAQNPLPQVEASVNDILGVLKDDTIQGAAQREQLSSLIRQRFDFATMSQYVLGPQWRISSAAEKDRFTALFTDLLEASYLGKIEAYSDEKVSFTEERIEGTRAQVNTLVLSGSKEIPIEYRLKQHNADWLVYDVIIEGVSLVRTYRENYREIVRKEGLESLLERMQNKLVENRQEESTAE